MRFHNPTSSDLCNCRPTVDAVKVGLITVGTALKEKDLLAYDGECHSVTRDITKLESGSEERLHVDPFLSMVVVPAELECANCERKAVEKVVVEKVEENLSGDEGAKIIYHRIHLLGDGVVRRDDPHVCGATGAGRSKSGDAEKHVSKEDTCKNSCISHSSKHL